MHIPVPSNRVVRAAVLVAILMGLVVFILLIVTVVQQSARLDRVGADLSEAKSRQAGLEVAARQNADAARLLAEQVERLGGEPKVEPQGLPPVTEVGPQGARGRPPTDAEIASAVAAYCADGSCRGQGVTPSEVAEAVADYCDQPGRCRGPAGAAGRDGQDGQDGSDGRDGESVTGPQGEPGRDGPGPTSQQIADAVEAYCAARNGCRGPQGDRGDTGARGEQGPQGAAGSDSTVPGPPGPQGPQGEPGPTCPPGYNGQRLTVLTPQGGTRDVFACIADDQA